MYPLKTKAPYNPSNLKATANIYTTMYLGNYITWDYDEWAGSHPWVDIIPQFKHDNILACLDWVVHFAGFTDSNGNYIVLKHDKAPNPEDFSKTCTLFSCHLHLSEISLKTWDLVKEWDIIWKSWNTGNSTWEHLHFQIDTWNAPFHPYWPFSWKEASEVWLGFFEAVNRWLWIDNARKYTINPLVYLDEVSSHKWSSPAPEIHFSPASSTQTKSKYFNDVFSDIEEIDSLYESKSINWYSDWTFRPESNVSRWELLKMVYMFKKIDPKWSWTSFSDVSSDNVFFPYISSASQNWYIKWYSDWTFRPNNPVTRAEAIKIALNIIVWENNISAATDSDYQDINISDWVCKYANFVAANWLLDSVWKFYPSDNMKRKDLAILLFNLKDRI